MSFRCKKCNRPESGSPIRLVTGMKDLVVRTTPDRKGERKPIPLDQLKDPNRSREGEEIIQTIASEGEFCLACAQIEQPDHPEVRRRVSRQAQTRLDPQADRGA